MSDGLSIARIVTGVAASLTGLGAALDDPALLEGLLSDLGATLGADAGSAAVAGEVKAVLGALPHDLQALSDALDALDPTADPATLAGALASVVAALGQTVADAHTLLAAPPPSGPAPFDDPAFWRRFFDDALALLAHDVIRTALPGAYALLRVLGVAVEGAPGTGTPARALRWDRIPKLVSDPLSVLAEAYGWRSTLDLTALLHAVADAGNAIGSTVTMTDPAGIMAAVWAPSALTPDVVVPFLRISVYRAAFSTGPPDPVIADVDLGLELVPLPDDSGQGAPIGAALGLDLRGAAGQQFAPAPGVTLKADAGGDAGVRVELRPNGSRIAGPAAGSADVTAALEVSAQPTTPWVVGDPSGTRLAVGAADLRAAAQWHTTGSGEATVSLATQASVVLDLGAADGFLQAVLGGSTTVPFNGTLSWSSTTGLRLLGGTGLGGTVPLDLDIGGGLHVSNVSVQVVPQPNGARLVLGASGSLSFGVLTATVDTIGMALTVRSVAPGQPPGNIGPLDVALGFSPPRGLGLAVDADVVSGGGFVTFDQDHGQYAGALALDLESLGLTAIGLVQTKSADGKPIPGGYSLLVIIAVAFAPPVELGFGFSLDAVGGLLALNRASSVDALRAGVRSGTLADVLFPADPIGHGPQLVSELEAFFPVAPGRFLVGPMVQLQWGAPAPILTAELAVLVELPAPIRILILGVLRIRVPQDDDQAVVRITMDALGVLDFGLGQFSLDASLHDSKIAEFTLTGDMAMRLSWRGDPQFLISIGGYHPAYTPPPQFPTLNRLAIALSTGDNPKLSLSAYLAVTANTLQFGAKAQLSVTVGPVGFVGTLSFDTLIHRNPFGLQLDFAATMNITLSGQQLLGVGVCGRITGPAPWHLSGQATVSLLMISAKVSFAVDIGAATPPPTPPPTRVLDVLATEVATTANWSALPPSGEAVVTIAPTVDDGGAARAHPLGTLKFLQHSVPLALSLQKFGGTDITGPRKLALTDAAYGNATAATTPVLATFAPAQFLTFSDGEALSQPSFVDFAAGVELTASAPDYDELAVGDVAPVTYTVEVFVPAGEPLSATPHTLDTAHATRLAATAPATRARGRTAGARHGPGPNTVAVVVTR